MKLTHQNSSGRAPAHKKFRPEWAVIGVLLLACAAAAFFLYRPRAGNAVAVISVDGNELQRIPLWDAEDQIFSIEQETGKPVSFEIKDHAIRFINVTCPDHICEKAGWCDAPGKRAVCMPNRTSLICYSEAEMPVSP